MASKEKSTIADYLPDFPEEPTRDQMIAYLEEEANALGSRLASPKPSRANCRLVQGNSHFATCRSLC